MKNIKKERVRKDLNFIWADYERSPYRISLDVKFQRDNEIYKSLVYMVDRKTFELTIEHCDKNRKMHSDFIKQMHRILIEISENRRTTFEMITTVINNFICNLETVKKVYEMTKNESILLSVVIDADNYEDSGIISVGNINPNRSTNSVFNNSKN